VLRLRFVPVGLLLRKLELDFSFIAPLEIAWLLSCILGDFASIIGSLTLLVFICKDSKE
jgi:hypothetical protein